MLLKLNPLFAQWHGCMFAGLFFRLNSFVAPPASPYFGVFAAHAGM
jgi:hypothetical protein